MLANDSNNKKKINIKQIKIDLFTVHTHKKGKYMKKVALQK